MTTPARFDSARAPIPAHAAPIDRVMTGAVSPGPVVVKLGGAAVDDPARAPWLWPALANLHASSPGGAVLVHGGAVAVDRMLSALGMTTERRDGIRLTPDDQIGPITAVLAGTLNKSLVGSLIRAGANGVGLCLGDGGVCTVRRTERYSFDAGRVGEIVGGDVHLVRHLLKGGFLPILCSIGLDAEGQALNVNADEAAAGLARLLEASSMLLLTDVPGVLDRDGSVIDQLDRGGIETLIREGTISGGMIPKVRGALEAAETAGVPVIIAPWNSAEAIERLARGERAGTQIMPRPATGFTNGGADGARPLGVDTTGKECRPVGAVELAAAG